MRHRLRVSWSLNFLSFRKILPLIIFSVFLVSLAATMSLFGYNRLKTSKFPLVNQSPIQKIISVNKNIPIGHQTYEIYQPKSDGPKILKAEIDPVDVHVGDTQTLSLTVESMVSIASVTAEIETDKGSVNLPLSLSKSDNLSFVHRPYLLNKDNYLVPENNLGDLKNNLSKDLIANASSDTQLIYQGSWVVKDTHDTYYRTKFIVKDISEKVNSVTLAWSDACGISNSGDWVSSANCVIGSVDGVDNGNATVSVGNTLTLNSTFAFNPGKGVIVNGTLALGAGGQLKKTYLWQVDSDSDNYAPNSTEYAQDTAPAGGRRRYLLVTAQYDCSDTSSSIYPGVTTSSGSCSCGSYANTCSTSVGGSQSYTYCSSSGSYASGSSGCSCSRSTDGISCGSDSYGTCNRSSTCSGSGTQSKTTYACSGGSCANSSTTVSCSLTPTSAGTSCGTGTTTYGGWGSCSGSGSCPTSGTQSRTNTVTSYACNGSGGCVTSTSYPTESQACSINSTGWACASDVVSSCTWPYGTCVNVGDFTTTHYNCNSSGSCVSSIQYGTCLRQTDGTSCGSCNTCSGGSCVSGC